MNIIKKILLTIKTIFVSEHKSKALPEPIRKKVNTNKNEFKNSLTSSIQKEEHKKIDVLTCIGDGLGFKNPISS